MTDLGGNDVDLAPLHDGAPIESDCGGGPDEIPPDAVMAKEPNAFDVFPELVWGKVMDNLESPVDLWNLLDALPELEDVPNKIKISFDKVLPLVFKDLDKQDVLACRAVCKWWKKSVDHFLETHPSRQPYDASFSSKITGYRYCTLETKGMAYMTVITGVQRFKERLQVTQQFLERSSTVPPPVGRSVKFVNRYNAGWNELDQLLTIHDLGASIWDAAFVLGGAYYNAWNKAYYDILQRCLSKLPNLKSLSFGEAHVLRSLIVITDPSRVKMLGEQHENIDISLPQLLHLESLEMTNFAAFHSSGDGPCWMDSPCRITFKEFFHAVLVKYSPQLKKLSMSSHFWRDEYPSRLQNLTEFELDLERTVKQPLFDAIFQGLKAKCPKLEKVGVRIHGEISMKAVLDWIQICASVKTLTIISGGISRYVSCGDPLLPIVPNLTSLTLENSINENRVAPVRFLKCFPGLEYLKIQNPRRYDDPRNEVERGREEAGSYLYRYPNFTVGSGSCGGERVTIWTLFPKLKTFVLNGNTYAREMYERID